MFTFAGTREHAARKKMFAHAYAKSMMLKGKNATIIEKNVRLYLELIEREQASEIFSSLHYFSMETITEFLYGKSGKTFSLEGSRDHRALINDIVDPARRKYTWFVVHMPRFTGWLYSQTGFFSHMLRGFLPMQTPTTYTGARAHAMTACQTYASASTEIEGKDFALIAKLWEHHYTKKGGKLDDVDIAAECADHLLAGIDTTSDTLMFLIWSLSRPEHRGIQEKLRNEVRALSNDSLNAEGIPNVEVADKLPFVNAVIKETLRLFSPLPASEPRTSQIPTVIEGYTIPARTVVSVSPYSLHRNSEVFAEPLKFNPDRWLDPCENIAEMNRWFWAFSSGGRMCIGLNLAMAEMTTLVAALYRKYATTTTAGFDVMSPGVTSRFEMLYDENCSGVREHQCQIKFMAVP
ncbi:uncharacterized protein EKO05_0003212 [Ascochyta rabiei]|uniref:uncharacterized protein n=1 Tax=Didymella rabiei TaxID=5454 RepID=UPI00220C207C|nr:uncharacterized protein EKO05_0003212 [Ascochyta rabiei]UPX12671.1 hypothetical protein EKO05_0003212 [Ascochyta rabiei]